MTNPANPPPAGDPVDPHGLNPLPVTAGESPPARPLGSDSFVNVPGTPGDSMIVSAPGERRRPDPTQIADLINQIKESADKLAEDRTSRGDLKLLTRTI